MLTRERMRELIEQYGLNRVADEIMADTKPCIRLKLDYAPDDTIPTGASKMGGSPDVPQGFEWPVWNSVPLMFIAQVRLSDAKPFDEEDLLPAHGLLYFFFDQEAFWKMQYEDKLGISGPYHVIYLEDERTPLLRVTHPLIKEESVYEIHEYQAAIVTFAHDLTLFFDYPSYYGEGFQVGQTTLTAEEKENVMKCWTEAQKELPRRLHQLLGYEFDVQYIFQATRNAHAAWKIGEPDDWLLLFQVDTDDEENSPGFLWGDGGLIHYCINKDDLRAGNFNRVWLDLEGS